MEKGKYEQVSVRELRQGRKGKHFYLIAALLDELGELPDGKALKIPFKRIKGVPIANLRSSITRATRLRGIDIATYSDEENFYLWKRTIKTSSYERKVKRSKNNHE